ncbi:unnamed protein product, partial [Staurois parvus]
MPAVSAHQCLLSVQSVPPISAIYECCLTVPISDACQYSSVPISAAYQCPSVLPISAHQCRLSVPITVASLAHISEGEKITYLQNFI